MLTRNDGKTVKIVSPEWLTDCFKANALVDSSKHQLEVSKPKRSSSKSNEEEKKDIVVSLDDIIGDVYDIKFGNKKRRNPPKDMKDNAEDDDESDSFVEGKRKIKNKTIENELKTMKSDIKSKHYIDGEEVFSEDSYLFKWKPDFIEKKESFWDTKKDKFACNRSSTKKDLEEDKEESKGEVKKGPYNAEVIRELERLLKYYEAEGDKGRSFGYRKALSFLRSYKEDIVSVE